MATPPVFSAGSVLTASQMNAVGMWAITPSSVTNGTANGPTVTVGNAVASVTLNGVFSSDFDTYRVLVTGVDASNGGSYLTCAFGSATTLYYGSLFYDLFTGTNGYGRNNAASSVFVGIVAADNDTNSSFDVHCPNLAKWTVVHGTYYGAGYSGWFGGTQASTTQHTSLKIGASAGTLTGGTITVYGYRP